MSTTFKHELLMKDAEELLRELDRDITDEEVPKLINEYGIDLNLAASIFIDTYNGTNSFAIELKRKAVLYNGGLTPKQKRAALNCWRQDLLGLLPGQYVRKTLEECFVCHEKFEGMAALMEHKAAKHSTEARKHDPRCLDNRHDIKEPCPLPPETPEVSVLETNDKRLGVDLTELPSGYYAIPDITQKQPWIFLRVSRQRQTRFVDRRYVWGKIQTGGEWIEAGTIEVRYFHGDSKELVGYQKPGQPYEGKFQVELEAVMKAPEPWALMFAKEIGRCGICGKTLTDEISRNDGYGPECIEKINNGYWQERENWRTKYVNRDETGLPFCPKHQQYHQLDWRCKG